MARKPPRQVVYLKALNPQNPKPTDPHFCGRVNFDRQVFQYILDCINAEEDPELFVSLWLNEDCEKAALGLAVPAEWVSPRNRSSREDFEWMD